MSKFGKLDKKQIALLLTLASVLGGKASAMNANRNQAKSSQSLGAVGGGKLLIIILVLIQKRLKDLKVCLV